MAFDTQLPLSDYAQLRANYSPDNPDRAVVVQDPRGQYHMFPHNPQSADGGFWQVQRNHLDLDSADNGRSGWKFHVSFHPDDMERAWSLASEHLMKKEIGLFKVTGPELTQRFSEEGYRQAGKFLTVYETGDAQNVAETLGELEQIFTRNGIRPGPDVQHDRKVPGSRYLSYRNDKSAQGHYLDSRELENAPADKAFNVGGHPDPWQMFRVIPAPPLEQIQSRLAGQLKESLNAHLPDAPVQDVEWTDKGWKVSVPSTYSRQEFAKAGINPDALERKSTSPETHHVTIPKAAMNAYYDPHKTQANMVNFTAIPPMRNLQAALNPSAPAMQRNQGGHAR